MDFVYRRRLISRGLALNRHERSARDTAMSKLVSALILLFIGTRRERAYRPELHYMRGPGPKCRA